MKKCLIIVMGFTGVFLAATASAQTAGQDMKDAGRKTVEATKDVGHGTAKAVKTGARKTKQVARRSTHAVAHETREGAEKVEQKTH